MKSNDTIQPIQYTYKILSPSQIYLIDDHSLERLLKPYSAPEIPILYNLYEQYGSKWLSLHVNRHSTPSGSAFTSERSKSVQSRIAERLPLLLTNRRGERLKSIKTGVEDKLKSISVYEIPRIQVKIDFESQSYEFKGEEVSSVALSTKKNQLDLYLHSSQELDWLDISQVLVEYSLHAPDDSLISYIANLLSSSLVQLQRRGVPVERLLQMENSTKQLTDSAMEYKQNTNTNQHDSSTDGYDGSDHDNGVTSITNETHSSKGPYQADFTASARDAQSQLNTLLKSGRSYRGNQYTRDQVVETNEIHHRSNTINKNNNNIF
jgi:hypothetical protein